MTATIDVSIGDVSIGDIDYLWAAPFLGVAVRGAPVSQGSMKSLGPKVMVHSNAKHLKPWRAQIQDAIEDEMAMIGMAAPLDEPVKVEVTFTMKKPMSAPKRRRIFPVSAPDVDKLLRAVLDALTASGVIRDDSRVVETVARKVFPGEHMFSLPTPGAIIWLSRIAD
jgi:Holliday junction resolvase RusA-like endonuclease